MLISKKIKCGSCGSKNKQVLGELQDERCKTCGVLLITDSAVVPQPTQQNFARQGGERFEMMVDDVFAIIGRGTVAAGSVSRGEIKAGDKVKVVSRSGSIIEATVTGIEAFRKVTGVARAGDKIGLLLRGIDKSRIKQGDLITN